ncbi:hypothetical protein D1007_33645 [Hordeum vulgare]|nr:hypothetical protein D1007_33645 [Hordeum vulgare]
MACWGGGARVQTTYTFLGCARYAAGRRSGVGARLAREGGVEALVMCLIGECGESEAAKQDTFCDVVLGSMVGKLDIIDGDHKEGTLSGSSKGKEHICDIKESTLQPCSSKGKETI